MDLGGGREKCLVCGETFDSDALLERHYKSHVENHACQINNVTSESQDSGVRAPSSVSGFNNHSEVVVKVEPVQEKIQNDGFTNNSLSLQTAACSLDFVVKEEEKDLMGSPPVKQEDQESDNDSDSSSTDNSSDSSKSLPSIKRRSTVFSNSFCKVCGKGPFKYVKLHRRHCTGVKVEHRCVLCKARFQTSQALNEHYIPLYSCEICGQTFSHQASYQHHKCPKSSGSGRVLFCSEVMPIACKICKCFFTSEAHLSNHITAVHSSLVRTKVCIIKSPSGHNDKSILLAPHQLPSRNDFTPVQVNNGTCTVDKRNAKPLTVYNGSSFLPSCTSVKGAGKTPESAAPHPDAPPAILAIFEHDAEDAAPRRRSAADWRFKPSYRCRECGATVRQRSFIIVHRYLHRGKRLHHCHCGRRFKRRLHLLRHCVQHAEAVDYICASCGKTFTGSKLIARHLRSRKDPKSNGRKRRCEMKFTCDCGLSFLRPSAYIWHHIQKHMDTRHRRKRLK